MGKDNPHAVVLRLRARLLELDGDETAREEERAPVALDQQAVGRLSRMDALQLQAMAEAQERRRRCEKDRIEAALERLEAGCYGYCTVCGEEIGLRRLEFDPAVTTCIRCAGRRN